MQTLDWGLGLPPPANHPLPPPFAWESSCCPCPAHWKQQEPGRRRPGLGYGTTNCSAGRSAPPFRPLCHDITLRKVQGGGNRRREGRKSERTYSLAPLERKLLCRVAFWGLEFRGSVRHASRLGFLSGLRTTAPIKLRAGQLRREKIPQRRRRKGRRESLPL